MKEMISALLEAPDSQLDAKMKPLIENGQTYLRQSKC